MRGVARTLWLLLALASCARAPQSPPERTQPPAKAPASGAPEEEGKVARADDGDTVTLEGGRQVRYLGIDTPERGEPYADGAQAMNRKLVAGRAVRLGRKGPEDTDRHGRLLRAVYVEQPGEAAPVCVNVALVRAGLAMVYVARDDAVDAPFLRELLEAQGEAIETRKNIWRGLLESAGGPRRLVSSRWRIHRESCAEISRLKLRPVSSTERELRSGKSPCRSCKPLVP